MRISGSSPSVLDKASLRRLASDGLPPGGARAVLDLASWCQEYGEAAGDAAFLITSSALEALGRHWEDAGWLSKEASDALERSLASHLLAVVDGHSANVATVLKREVVSTLQAEPWHP